jgi:iron complex transport system ATP-binding protein
VAPPPDLTARNLTLERGGRVLCRALDVRVRAGELWGILGPNGSGKTTLLHALCGLLRPASGSVAHDGARLDGMAAPERARRVGILLQQDPGSFWGTARDYAMLGVFPHGTGRAAAHAAAQAALVEVGVADLADRDFDGLSGGERQRVRLAQLIAQSPLVYCLDEPLAHLDLRHRAETMGLLRRLAVERDRAVVAVLHEAYWASRYCDRVLLLGPDGRAEAGEARGLLTRERLADLYQCDPEVTTAFGV